VRLEGVYLPITTPFEPATGEVDLEAFSRNLAAWHSFAISGVVVGGSTGEAALLDESELLQLVEGAVEACPENRAVIVGAGAESTRATIRLALEAAARGADAVLVRPPYYYRGQMTDEVLRIHFLAVADASPIPVVLYHVPKFVPVELVPQLVGELVQHDDVVGIKDSSGDIHNLGALCEACAGRADVVVGAGTHLYPGLEIGATGGIVAVGLMATEEACDLVAAFHAGRGARAGALQERIGPLHKSVVSGSGIPGLKHALDLLDLTGGSPRPPLLPPTEETRKDVAASLERAGLLDPARATGPNI
jgi:4-hydroxy-2-oxoglutarate aldolase